MVTAMIEIPEIKNPQKIEERIIFLPTIIPGRKTNKFPKTIDDHEDEDRKSRN